MSDIDLSQPPVVEEEEQKEEETQEEKEPENAGEALFAFPGSPNQDQIEEWKQLHGEVLVSAFSEKELFVFRPVSRAEWTNLQLHLQNAKEPITQQEVERLVVDTCVLWASQPGIAAIDQKAGTLSTLHEQVLQSSYFVNPAYAASLVARL